MKEVLAEFAFAHQLFQIAVRGDDHAHVHRDGLVAADALHLALFQHAQQLGLHGERHVADFVEEERAARCACSNLPMWRDAAPVNEPFSWPKSSDSISSAGTAAQLRVTNGPLRRGLLSCSVRATSSLPVPVSPQMQTRDSLAATRSICAITRRMASPDQTISCLPSRALSSRFSCSRRLSLSAFSTVSSSLSVESGFSRKSSAPRRVARTAISMCAWPDIMTTGAVTPLALQIFQQREAVAAGHHDVGEDQVEVARLGQFQRFGGVVADGGFVSGEAEGARERRQRVGFVVDDQDVGFAIRHVSIGLRMRSCR